MIVLNVGACKNGSTWLSYITKYLNEDYFSSNAEIPGDNIVEKLKNAISYSSLSRKNYLFKYHYFVDNWNQCENIYLENNLYYINIIRSFEDVLVSRFFHQKNISKCKSDFNTFFLKNNKMFFEQYVKHHYSWTVAPPISMKPRIKTFYYYEFKHNFLSHSQELANFLAMPNYNCARAQSKTTLPELKENHTEQWMKKFQRNNSSFYRKGIVGDSINYFTQDMYDEVENLKQEDARYSKIVDYLQYESLK